jgi:hypothetical protein
VKLSWARALDEQRARSITANLRTIFPPAWNALRTRGLWKGS